jgi:hypothetical protein
MLSMKSTTTTTNHTNTNNNNNKSNNSSSSSQDYQRKKNLIISKIIEFVLRRKAHEDLVLPFDVEGKFTTKIPAPGPGPGPTASILLSLEDFIAYGFTISLGEWQGQIADYRYMLPDKRSIHLRVFPDHFRLHWDYIDPRADPLGHIAVDAPHWLDMTNNAITTITRILQMMPQSGKEVSK